MSRGDDDAMIPGENLRHERQAKRIGTACREHEIVERAGRPDRQQASLASAILMDLRDAIGSLNGQVGHPIGTTWSRWSIRLPAGVRISAPPCIRPS
jgi:hypothetical protein